MKCCSDKVLRELAETVYDQDKYGVYKDEVLLASKSASLSYAQNVIKKNKGLSGNRQIVRNVICSMP